MNKYKPEFFKRFIATNQYATRQIIVGTLSRYTEKEVKGLFVQGIKQSIVAKLNKLDCFVYIEEIDNYFSPDVADVEEIIKWVHEQMPDVDEDALKIYVCYKWREYVNAHLTKVQKGRKPGTILCWNGCILKPAYSWEEGVRDYFDRYVGIKIEKIPCTLRNME